MKYSYIIKRDAKILHEGSRNNGKLFTVCCAMEYFYGLVGHGDNENGGKGSLWNCAPDIFQTLWEEKEYSYADVSVKIIEVKNEQ